MELLPPREEMERAFFGADASYNGLFYTAVRTTGIFCLPSCTARKPRAENVEFFGSAKEALFAGYRPCKKCDPLRPEGDVPEWVAVLLAEAEKRRLSEADLRELGVEPARARRYFLKQYGMTFQAYARARRLGGAFEMIREGASIDDAVWNAGYDSHSGFRDAFARVFGEPPGKSRESDCIVTSWVETPLGAMIAGASRQGVCLLEFTDRRMLEAQVATLRKRFGCSAVPGESAVLEDLKKELELYFAGVLRNFTVPLVYPGTPFETKVWNALLQIPYGITINYEELASVVGSPGASRAAGSANGRNRLGILIPCHRVVAKSGELGGYGGGLWRKRALLDLERRVANCDAPGGKKSS